MCKVMRSAVDTGGLRQALGAFSTGVAVVTAISEAGAPIGMTVNSFSSISLNPPLVGWCVDRRAAGFRFFAACNAFNVSILAQDQIELAKRFATRGADKFAGIEMVNKVIPLIPEASAWFRCSLYRQMPLGDHLMLVGEVKEFERGKKEPLVFSAGTFGTFQSMATDTGIPVAATGNCEGSTTEHAA